MQKRRQRYVAVNFLYKIFYFRLELSNEKATRPKFVPITIPITIPNAIFVSITILPDIKVFILHNKKNTAFMLHIIVLNFTIFILVK